MVLVESGKKENRAPQWFVRSSAVLRIAARLQPTWLFSLLWLVLLLPAIVRDTGYRIFASLRYRLFGKFASKEASAECREITRALRPRFLELVVKRREKEMAKANGGAKFTSSKAEEDEGEGKQTLSQALAEVERGSEGLEKRRSIAK